MSCEKLLKKKMTKKKKFTKKDFFANFSEKTVLDRNLTQFLAQKKPHQMEYRSTGELCYRRSACTIQKHKKSTKTCIF